MATFIIAEIGMNHDGSFGNAKSLITAAKDAGVDAVKFQYHIFDEESLENAPKPKYFDSESRKDFFERTSFTIDQWAELKVYSESIGLEFLISPFSIDAARQIRSLGVNKFKIPSGEISNFPLIEYVSNFNAEVILSSGMSTWDELDKAVSIVQNSNSKLSILQCTSEYPCPYENVGLNLFKEIQEKYSVTTGLSDHTLTIFAPIVIVANGGKIIEKHFTLSRQLYGPDAKFSLEPNEMKQMVDGIRATEIMLDNLIDKDKVATELSYMKLTFEKSIVLSHDMEMGGIITMNDIAFKKPGDGINAKDYKEVLYKKLNCSLKKNEKLLKSHLI